MHSTCKGHDKEKFFLNTVVTRDRVTGKGVPLAFMLINHDSYCPLEHFLRQLHMELKTDTGIIIEFEPDSIMIDCSDTEALTSNNAFAGPFQGCSRQRRACRACRTALGKLLDAQTPEAFQEHWEFMQAEYGNQRAWIKYLEDEYIKHKERWGRAWRLHAHYRIDTNNHIEIWHSNLKNYIGHGRKMRLDYMIHILTQDVKPGFMHAHVRCRLGFQGRHLCTTEKAAKERAERLTFEDAERCVEELKYNLVVLLLILKISF
ncbi:hypothetical protein M422DRAFT_242174 [Sphaerobolus stellatus SS14]|nr:hypothetical protein M422DRAFT_242174 [Sphaerobolus stellatus SS14]